MSAVCVCAGGRKRERLKELVVWDLAIITPSGQASKDSAKDTFPKALGKEVTSGSWGWRQSRSRILFPKEFLVFPLKTFSLSGKARTHCGGGGVVIYFTQSPLNSVLIIP